MDQNSPAGNPRHNELVANIARIRATVLTDLWQSDGDPDGSGTRWWEIWLRPAGDDIESLQRYAHAPTFIVSPRVLRLSDRVVTWVHASWSQLEPLPFTAVPVAEIRRPEFIDTIEDLTSIEQAEFVADLAARLEPADPSAPAVCHLDTGVARTHVLLEASLDPQDLHTVLGVSGFDQDGHGTKMAGLALFDRLDDLLASAASVQLRPPTGVSPNPARRR